MSQRDEVDTKPNYAKLMSKMAPPKSSRRRTLP